ncbi:MAG TPA: hypothetical protein VHW01_30955 [Polyangiaceae bacterium]|nr:hypothetical protein [Polyangiaceae bacterium]
MSGKRWLLVLAAVVLIVLGAAAALLLVVLPRYVEAKVLSTAEEQGVTLEPADISFGWGWVQITQVRVSLDKVRSVAMQVGRIESPSTAWLRSPSSSRTPSPRFAIASC